MYIKSISVIYHGVKVYISEKKTKFEKIPFFKIHDKCLQLRKAKETNIIVYKNSRCQRDMEIFSTHICNNGKRKEYLRLKV